jgi:hypothetical protein
MTDHIYEEPATLRRSDWEEFRDRMRAEVVAHPERPEAIEALAFAERILCQLRLESDALNFEAA